MTDICGAKYVRPSALHHGAPVLVCNYIKHHPITNHSWFAIKTTDDSDLKVLAEQSSLDETPSDVAALLDNIASGHADPYLEAILAAAHARKRSLRGVRAPFGVILPGERRTR